MTVDPKIRNLALQELRERRAAAQTRLAMRREEVYAAVPRIKEIDSLLRQSSARAVMEAFKNGEDAAAAIDALREENLDLQAEKCELLVAHGYGKDYLESMPECSRCGDTGYIGAESCSCLKELTRRYQVQELSSLLDMENVSFDTFDFSYYSDEPDPRLGVSPRDNAENAFDYCAEYARNFGSHKSSLFLNGGTGLGKTFLSTCIAREVAAAGYSVVYDTAVGVLGHFETEHFSREEDEAAKKAVRRCLECDLLIVDDLGTELTTSFTQTALYTIINTRLMAGKQTVINSNLTMEEVRRRYSPQILSRLEGEYNTVFFFGRDIRLQKKQRG